MPRTGLWNRTVSSTMGDSIASSFTTLTTGAAAALLPGLEVVTSEELHRQGILSEKRTKTADLRGAMENLRSRRQSESHTSSSSTGRCSIFIERVSLRSSGKKPGSIRSRNSSLGFPGRSRRRERDRRSFYQGRAPRESVVTAKNPPSANPFFAFFPEPQKRKFR